MGYGVAVDSDEASQDSDLVSMIKSSHGNFAVGLSRYRNRYSGTEPNSG